MTAVHVVVPAGIDDPTRPSGGNTYDRRICRGLAALGWSVHVHPVPGAWPRADASAHRRLQIAIAGIPDGALVLLDGLIASAIPHLLTPEAERLRLVVLVHLPLGEGGGADEAEVRLRERAALSSAVAIVATSAWTRRRLLDRYALSPGRVHVAEPGVDVAELVRGTEPGGRFICVAAVAPNKGHDVLLAALATMTDLAWHLVCDGSVTGDPCFVARLARQAQESGIVHRVRFAGSRTGAELAADYAQADVLVLPSRVETYGMVVTEALARGLPVIATAVGGLPQALGRAPDGCRPGLLVAPEDPATLSHALRSWLTDSDLRRRLRQAAHQRRATLTDWSVTSACIARVLAEASA